MVLKKDLERRYKLYKQEAIKLQRLKRYKKMNKKLKLTISKN